MTPAPPLTHRPSLAKAVVRRGRSLLMGALGITNEQTLSAVIVAGLAMATMLSLSYMLLLPYEISYVTSGRMGEYSVSAPVFVAAVIAFFAVGAVAFVETLSVDPLANVAGRRLAEKLLGTLQNDDREAGELVAKLHDYYERVLGRAAFEGKIVNPSVTSRRSFYEPREASRIRRSITRAIRAEAKAIAPSNLLLVVATLAIMTAVGTYALFFGYNPGPDVSLLVVVADQILKGFVVDVAEFFSISLAEYQLPHERKHQGMYEIGCTAILFALRTIPAFVFFRGLQLSQQRAAIETVMFQLYVVEESALVESVQQQRS